MKKLLLWTILLSTLTIGGCSITLNEAAASDVECETLENNFNILTTQLGKLQTENDEQKIKIQELEKVYEDNTILSGEVKKLNKKVIELNDETIKLKEENEKLKDENSKLKDENKKLLAEKDEIATDYSGSKSKIANYIGIIKKLKEELSTLKDEISDSQSGGGHFSAPKDPNYISENKIETNNIYTPDCEYTTKVLSENNTMEDMPNKNWTDDIKFINNILQVIQDSGENLAINYINEANYILDSKGLTKRDQCRYSLLIDILKNQKGVVTSYENENGKIKIGINFIMYKEDISWDDRLWNPNGGIRDLEKSQSIETKYYTLSENPELETLNVDRNGFLYFSGDSNTIFINDRDSRINRFCNDEPIYTEILVGDLAIHDTLSQYYNQNNGHYCIKDRLDTKGAWFMFGFDENGQIKKIKAKYNLTR